MANYILSIDQGTTGTTAILFNSQAEPVGKGYSEFKQIYPQPGWVEHNPKDILKSVHSAVLASLQESQVNPNQIKSIGITNQRETVLCWNPKSKPSAMKSSYNAIVWQCRRTSEFTEKLKKDKKKTAQIFKTTGLVVDPYFSASKMKWLIENKYYSSGDVFGTVDTFLIWHLTGGKSFLTDYSNASRTQLLNLKKLNWDKDLLKFFKIPQNALPQIQDSNSFFGETLGFECLPDGIPIYGVLGDQQSALFGHGAFKAGDAKCTFGTGSFILMNTGQKPLASKNKLLTTIAWKLKNEKVSYALEGSAFICGAAVQFLRDQFRFFKSSDEIEVLAEKATKDSGVVCVPAHSGLAAPYWDPEARAAILGLTRGTGIEEVCLATLEGMALQNAVILESMQKDSGLNLTELKVDGGAVQNMVLMQLQSDMLQKQVLKPNFIEVTARGAALMAGLGSGFWSMKDILKFVNTNKMTFKPLENKSWQKDKRKKWDKAIKAVQSFV